MLRDYATIISFLLLLTFPKLVWITLTPDNRTRPVRVDSSTRPRR
jgi:hypothetical protein